MVNKGASKGPLYQVSLKQRVLNAGAWSLAGYCLSQTIRFGSSLVMTRVMAPEFYGLIAIGTLVITALQMFSDLGLKLNVIQSARGSDSDFLNTAWSVQILRGLVLWVSALGISVLVFFVNHNGLLRPDSVYADPQLPFVIGWLSITALISGFQSTKLYESSRFLSLGRVTQIEIVAQVMGLFCMLLWAYFERSVWAMVAGTICSSLVTTGLSHVWLPGSANRWRWDPVAFNEILHFGKWIFLSSILGFLVSNGDRLLLGGLVNPSVFGVYVIAYFAFSSLEQVFAKLIADISFPALSEIARDRRVDLKGSYYRFHCVIASFAYFCSGFLATSGEALIGLFYDPRYQDAGWMLQILAVALLTIPFRTVTGCFLALGMPYLLSQIIAIRTIALFVFTLLGFHLFDVEGALWGIVLSQFSFLPLLIIYSVKHDLFDIRKELLLLPLVGAGALVGKLFALTVGYQQ